MTPPNSPGGMNLQMQLRLQQKLSPQQIQTLHLIQCPTVELSDRIYKELEDNPTLELLGDSESALPDGQAGAPEEAPPRLETAAEDEPTTPESGPGTGVLDVLDNQRDYSSRSSARLRDLSDKKQEAMQNTPNKPESLQDYLRDQFAMMELPAAMKAIGHEIIYNVSDDGYFRTPLADIATKLGVTVEAVEEVLRIIQKLDPPGIAARNLSECLLLQIPLDDPHLALKQTIITKYLEYLQSYKLGHLAKLLDKSSEKIQQVVDEIKTLNPHPAADFTVEEIRYVTPDVFIFKVEGNYEIKINTEYIPSLIIREEYKQLMASKESDAQTKLFVRQKINSAKGFIQAIQLRKITLRQLSELILDYQREFFEKGVEFLKPLKMKEVAERFKLHISSVSRIVANKYIQTPHGLFPIKFFFSSATETADGNSYAKPSVQAALKEIIDKEDRKKPFKDSQLVQMMTEKQFKVSRRTISKYRQILNIPNYSLRRSVDRI